VTRRGFSHVVKVMLGSFFSVVMDIVPDSGGEDDKLIGALRQSMDSDTITLLG
jgi:hypothetical protein